MMGSEKWLKCEGEGSSEIERASTGGQRSERMEIFNVGNSGISKKGGITKAGLGEGGL